MDPLVTREAVRNRVTREPLSTLIFANLDMFAKFLEIAKINERDYLCSRKLMGDSFMGGGSLLPHFKFCQFYA